MTQIGGEEDLKLPDQLHYLNTAATKNPRGVYFAPPKKLWPKLELNRIDISRVQAIQGYPNAYWKDILLTMDCPTVFTAWTAIFRLRPFYGLGELFTIANYNGNYREYMHTLYSDLETRTKLKTIAASNEDWILIQWHARLQNNALKLAIDPNGNHSLEEILLYKEPLFVPKTQMDRSPCTYAGTTPGYKLHPSRDFAYIDIIYKGKKVNSYPASEISAAGNFWRKHILSTWNLTNRPQASQGSNPNGSPTLRPLLGTSAPSHVMSRSKQRQNH